MNAEVDAYIASSDMWPAEMAALRPLLLNCGLDEEIKWRKPCYIHDGHNIAIMQEMKGFLALMFFKGALLTDPDGLLEDQGPNSRSARRLTFGSVEDVQAQSRAVTRLVREAIDAEDAGLSVGPAPAEQWVEELHERLADDERFRMAFEALTPGRQREYNLFIGGAKQAKTRWARLEKVAPRILAGKGLRDR